MHIIENCTFVGAREDADRFVDRLFARGATRIENLAIVTADDPRIVSALRHVLNVPDTYAPQNRGGWGSR